jgi:hypothetical protein
LNWKLTPAAFPAFTTISPVARIEVWAGAMRVSWATGLPSAVIETQVVLSARIIREKVAGGFAAAEAVRFVNEGLALFVAGVVEFAGDAAVGAAFREGWAGALETVIEGLAAGEVLAAAEIVPGESFPGDKVCVSGGDAFAGFGGAAEADGWVATGAGAEKGAGD